MQVALRGEAVAVTARSGEATYAELDRRSNRLAHRLRAQGAGPDEFVGIALERDLDMVVAVIAVLKCGAAYIPLDVKYPRERLKFMIEDSRMRLALTHSDYGADIPMAPDRRLFLDVLDLNAGPDDRFDAWEDPCAPAYCIYTSGSTGQPKGVIVEHHAVANTVRWYARYLELTPEDRLFSICSFSFDVSICELWPALLVGARCVLSSPNAPVEPDVFFAEICAHRATVLAIVPSLLSSLLVRPDIPALTSLRHVVSTGEPLSGNLRDRFREICGARLHNLYGPTETSVWASGTPVEWIDQNANVSIGRPIENTKIEILDASLMRVEPGSVGEIYIGGAGLARGYLNRDDLTRERFLADPFGRPGARLYRSGDLGRVLPDGRIECLGRLDDQIKVRGFRVELGEIQSAIAQAFPVADVAVIVTGASEADRSLVAFVAPDRAHSAGDPEPYEVLAALRTRLPAYMTPSRVLKIECLPVTPNGKLDKPALAALASQNSAPKPAALAGRSAFEMAEMMSFALGIPVGAGGHFHDLGGTSLQTLKLSSLIEQRMGRRVPASLIYDHPTPEALAAVVDASPEDAGWTSLFPLNQTMADTPLICLHGFEGTVDNYVHLAYHLNGLMPLVGLRVHPNWRTTYVKSIAALVGLYEAEIVRAQGDGPFHLCGYSYGGVPAFELACRLEKRGVPVTLLLLDAFPQTYGVRARTWWPRLRKMVEARDTLRTTARKLDEFLRFELHYWRHGYDRDLDHGLKRAALRVKHGVFGGRTILFQTRGADDARAYRLVLDGVNGWSRHIARPIELVTLDSGHVGLVKEPTVRAVAAKIRELGI